MKPGRYAPMSRREILTTAARATVGVGIAAALGRPVIALAQGAGTDNAFTNSIGMAFVPVAAGTFLMGSPASDRQAQAYEKPQHRVTISRPFQIGKHEVTQGQYAALMGGARQPAPAAQAPSAPNAYAQTTGRAPTPGRPSWAQ